MFYFVLYGKQLVGGEWPTTDGHIPTQSLYLHNVPLLRAKGVGVGKGDSNHCKARVSWCQSFEN